MLEVITDFIIDIWKQIMETDVVIDKNTNFFGIGGNSLQVMQCLRAIEKKYPDILKISDFFVFVTPEELAQYIVDNI